MDEKVTRPAIELTDVHKRYRSGGGISGVSLDVHPGEVYGFLGPNGAGKSTSIRLILDLIRPDSGRIEVLGLDARRDSVEVHRHVGYLPGELSLYDRFTGRGLLGHLASLRHDRGQPDIDPLAERFDLELDRRIGELSKGNKQKVGLVQALMGSPEVLVLDEPTSGLDPLAQREVHHALRERCEAGAAVLLSSHVLSEVDQVADRVGILRNGSLVATETMSALRARSVHHVEIRTSEPLSVGEVEAIPGASVSHLDGTRCVVALAGPVDPLIKFLAHHQVLELRIGEADLEQTFLSYYSDDEQPDRGAGDADA